MDSLTSATDFHRTKGYLLAIALTICGCQERLDGASKKDSVNPHAPVVSFVEVTPSSPKVDGPVSCLASYSDPDGDDVTVSYSWTNATSGDSIGTGAEIWLSPSTILPGERLECRVVVEDPSGFTGESRAEVVPECGFYDSSSLSHVNFSIYIVFRPWTTNELEPGYEGEPWDWDGDIPDWIMDVADALGLLADIAVAVDPDPAVMTAAEAIELANEVLDAIEEYGPALLQGSVPPDPDMFPYLIDDDYYIYTYWDGEEGLRENDTYEFGIEATDQNLLRYAAFVVDMEDVDTTFDDNMGDWLDQGSDPLLLTWDIFDKGAYCSSIYYNPTNYGHFSSRAWVPSSILLMEIVTW